MSASDFVKTCAFRGRTAEQGVKVPCMQETFNCSFYTAVAQLVERLKRLLVSI